MILTTTNSIEGKTVDAYLGIVVGEAVMGVNIFKDMFASIRDIVGGRTAAYEQELEKARRMALRELSQKAHALNANAVIGIDLDYQTLSGMQGGNMLMVSVAGTAVRLA